MPSKVLTLTIDFDDASTEEHMEAVTDDIELALEAIFYSGNYNDECPGYDHVVSTEVDTAVNAD